MKQEQVERHAAAIIDAIDDRMRAGSIPTDALTFADVSEHATEPFGDIAVLDEFDRDHVVRRVDEVLRIRAGGVD